MSLRAVFFDLDGTLLDTATDMGNALNALLVKEEKNPLPLEVIRNHVSNGAAALVKLGFNITLENENFPRLRQHFLDCYLTDLASHTEPFPGIDALIKKLAKNNVAWGIVTNKPWAYTEPLLRHFRFASDPVAILCPDHVKERKPAPDSLFLACQQANCHVDEAIYVGDHARDIECGIRAGMNTIAVGYGYINTGDDHRTWGATHAVDNGDQLWPIIKTYL